MMNSLNTMRSIPPAMIPEEQLNTMKMALMHGDAHAQAEGKKPSAAGAGPARSKRTKQLQPLTQQLTQASQVFQQILNNRTKAQASAAAAGTGAQPPSFTGAAGATAPTPPHHGLGVGGIPHVPLNPTPNPASLAGIPA
jgi:glycerate kinase